MLSSTASRATGRRLLLGVLALALTAPLAWAQLPGLLRTSPSPVATPVAAPLVGEPDVEAADSPRASVRAFVELTAKKGQFQGAARYLVLPPGEEGRGPELARRLSAVLERYHAIDLDLLSPVPEGNLQDGLPQGVDAVGQVPDGEGGHDTVFLVRMRDGAPLRWAFSRQTVARVDGWYEALSDRWVRELVPGRLQRYGPWNVMWWQWLAFPVLAALALALGRLLGAATARALHRLARRTPTDWDEPLLARISPALTLLWTLAVAALLMPRLELRPGLQQALAALLGGAATLGVVWVLWRAVDVWAQFLLARPWAVDNPSARSLLSVTRNLSKVLVAVGGIVATLAALGYPVATVLAGLGIGGIAIAFGAQKTIENLFGSISLAADQPFRVGDLVRVEDITGNVERIGMRSTQIRTADRTLVSLPNGQLADMRIEDFASRDRIRFGTTLGLDCGTSEQELRRVVSGIEALLRASPKVWPETVVAKLAGLSPASLDVEVLCWFETSDFAEFRELRQQALLGILRVVAEAGARFAFPTQAVRVMRAEDAPAPRDR
jgi:MscS family membrane protein